MLKKNLLVKIAKGIMFVFAYLLIAVLPGQTAYAEPFEVHFLNVGQADAAIVKCDDEYMLIDGGNSEDSDLIYSYLKQNKIQRLEYIVCTHADADHVGGLPGAVECVKENIGTVLAPYRTNEKERFQTFVKKLDKYGHSITVPSEGSSYELGDGEIKILSVGEGGNDDSIVLRVEYGKNAALFMGDASVDVEDRIIDKGYKVDCDILKVGHHGSASSTGYRLLREARPAYAVISCGKNNSYGHPTEETLSKLSDLAKVNGTLVYRTDNNGHIVFSGDGKKLSVTSQKTQNQETNLIPGGSASTEKTSSKYNAGETAKVTSDNGAAAGESDGTAGGTQTYILNTNTKKFHKPDCSSVDQMAEHNKKKVTDSRNNIISQGYVPCKRCNP